MLPKIPGRLVQIEFRNEGTIWVAREIAPKADSGAYVLDSMHLDRDDYNHHKYWVITTKTTGAGVFRQVVAAEDIRVFGFLEGELNGDDADPKG